MSQLKQAENTSGIRRFWPVLGFIMLIALAIISYFLSPYIITLAHRIVPAFRGSELPAFQMRLIFTVLTFVVVASIGAGVVALTAPKSRMRVREGDMAKERTEMLKAKAEQKRRQRKINRAMRKE